MKIYQTNASLGYNQLAYLIKLNKSENGFNYLCIGTKNTKSETYKIGEIVKDLEDFYVEKSDYKIFDSPLNSTFLFDYFVTNYSERNKLDFSIEPMFEDDFNNKNILNKIEWFKREINNRYIEYYYPLSSINNKKILINNKLFIYDNLSNQLFIEGRAVSSMIYNNGEWAETIKN